MKQARFLFTVIAIGAWTLGVSYADGPSRQPSEQAARQNPAASDRSAHGSQAPGKIEQADGKPSKPKNDRQNSKEDGHAKDLKPKDDSGHSKPKEEGRVSEKGRKAGPVKSQGKKEPKQPEPKKAATAAKVGPMTNKTGKPREQPAKSPAGNEALAPRPGLVRTRGATAALVSRVLITSNTKYSAGPLAGVATQRKP
jgi:hypothetical protein